ncbi:YciI family protein [Paractinoplanes lichenicola]|uniref:YciI family protein n=1 Tax=Paractinoplanes lichenicola TaxID=2802976 RepID=A0ABS1VT86_9ACTN|nr:YciI family protein [Actinoplanes lichenicola]MBL7257674.1 YciI family protein [Actinoplanes lichenicola]
MKYALLMYSVEKSWAEADEATREQVYAAHGRFSELLRERDAERGGEELALSNTATTVRVRDGEPLLTDGPYAETAEQLGGFYLVEARDLDEALEFARQLATVEDIIEVRPVVEHPAA